MKTHIFPLRLFSSVALGAASVAFGLFGCSKHDQTQASATAKEAYADTKAAISNAWDKAKAFTFEQRNDFAANAKALSAKMDAQLSDLRADYSDAKASAARKAAMAELKSSEADYKEKLNALGSATAATWDSAKQNTIAAWDRLQAAYYKAKSSE